jgi:hypothetical protein
MVLFAGVNGADNGRQSVTGNCQLANDVSLHRSIAIMQGDESRGFQLVTANSLKTRFVSASLS